MSELSMLDAIEREERETAQHDKLRQRQRFVAALRFAATEMVCDGGAYKHPNFDEAIDMADTLIKKLEAPTR